jgi:glycerol dehydrogenase
MRNGKPYFGGGRYIQSEGASSLLGTELTRLGARKAFIIGGRTALSLVLPRIEAGMKDNGIDWAAEEFSGHCTLEKCASLRTKAVACHADVIVGSGGGKALDTAKMLANDMKLDVVTVPTQAATCAAFAVLSVVYAENGDMRYCSFHDRDVACILVDTDIIVSHSPARMLASGIADAAAKYPEVAFSMEFSADWDKAVLPGAALALSRFTWDGFGKSGAKAVADLRAKRLSPEVEDMICAGIALTGTVSSLISGGRQLAVAHTLYDAVCKHFKDQQRRYLHGEIVSAGIPLQMHVNGMDPARIESTKTFLRSLGTPVSLSDIGIEPSPANIDTIFAYIWESMNFKTDWFGARLREGLSGILSEKGGGS